MMLLISQKKRVLLLVAAMIVALTLLATSFGSLEFQTGRTFSLTLSADERVEEAISEMIPSEPTPDSPTQKLLYNLLVYVLIPLSIFYTVFTRSGRESLRRALINGLVAAAFYIVLIRLIERLDLGQNQGAIVRGGTVLSIDTMPPAFVAALSFGISSTLIVIAGLIYLRWRVRPQPAAAVSISAREAIAEIRAGGELRSIVLRCYQAMLETVRVQAGVERLDHVTPREFEAHLIGIGLPSADVQQLTRLFERVRYGENDADSASERKRAVYCLNTIVNALEGQQ
jgi:hypothetical protein